jgi:methyltransferase (TIGR00027 family)
MPGAKAPLLRSVSDTALLVAYHRAMETKRPDALFRDEFAVRLSEGRGEEIARTLTYGRRMAWTTIVRTILLDDIVQRLVAGGVDGIVNIAAGLDARPYRLPLPASLRWIEVDLPAMVRDKTEALAHDTPVCRLERVPLDVADAAARRALLTRIGSELKNVLVITEGLLVYLPPDTVGQLADDLAAQPSIRHWATDLATPMIRKRVNRWWGRKFKQANTNYQFAPEEGTRFFAPHGWREAEFHALFEEGMRVNRMMSGMWMFEVWKRIAPKRTARMMEKWRAGVALLERST